jgi:hypothetical protein
VDQNTYKRDEVVQEMSLAHPHARKAFMGDVNDVDMEVVCTRQLYTMPDHICT